jgi:hypothetical protein
MLQIPIFINNMTDEITCEVKEKLNLGYSNYAYIVTDL